MANRVISTTGAYTGYTAASSIDATADYMLIQQSGAYAKINRNTLLGLASAPLGSTDSQTVTNKTLGITNTVTLTDNLFTLQDNSDNTKQAQFQLSGITTGTTRTYTVPNASVTLASLTGTETFTNKTITSPTITGGTYDNGTITVDSIGEHTAANGVTIDSLNIKDGKLNTNNSVVTTNITDANVTSEKLDATIACRAYLNAAQSISSGALRKVNLDAENYDLGSNYDTTNYRFTAPVTGYYQVNATVGISNLDAAGDVLVVAIYVNGADYSESRTYAGAANNDPQSSISDLVPVTAGQYIELYAQHDSATASEALQTTSLKTHMSIYFVGV